MGFYCSLHGYQKPRQSAAEGCAPEAAFEQHLRTRTSFLAPEHSVAAEMCKAINLLRDRPGAPKSAAGNAILAWLIERRSLPEESAKAMASRMLSLGILVPFSGNTRSFDGAATALYKVTPKLVGTR
jgi:hypothetical protein